MIAFAISISFDSHYKYANMGNRNKVVWLKGFYEDETVFQLIKNIAVSIRNWLAVNTSECLKCINLSCVLANTALLWLSLKFYCREILPGSVAFSVFASLWRQLWLMVPSALSIRRKMNSKRKSASDSLSASDLIRVTNRSFGGNWFILLCGQWKYFHLAVRPLNFHPILTTTSAVSWWSLLDKL